ncbi:DNA (cytosine-5)-methyltransferase 1/DNA (cytosine-5)-methyltransferase 3A [Maribacter dokdonensis]|uniref:DNA (cytosine-5-)-methyltransferase n=1 Tax=Maribacter dokdonensis TaxID=320912 RepID=A0ABY0V0G2_9FLAO|nr:DNA cytosine methyltransferase [Maribacter dokdonensis]SDT46653.1 DNA (cytosine-5)-methyltransferase 1/DNA (cytosine-5)-methyltransferase 3A [Maribacter dokdonensis]SDT47937.1 DNA (cytosine-5)-methyltransferase 1/DNA (cytosine-5)-methyltransferase 3A [Maribacter dokdonensis]
MNVLSLFDGGSMGQLSLTKAGHRIENYFASEIDEHAIKVTQRIFPDTVQLGDVKNIDVDSLPKIDLLIGGSPCQGFSNAGKGLNFDDPRSALFFEFVHILNKVREKNPDVKFLLENVRMKKEHQKTVSDFLGVPGVFICSSNFSAQKRKRFYWTNFCELETLKESKEPPFLKDILTPGEQAENLYLTEKHIERAAKNYAPKVWASGNKIGRMNFPNKQNWKTKCLLTSVSKSSRETNHVDDGHGIRVLSIEEMERAQGLPVGYTEGVSNTQRVKIVGNGWNVPTLTFIFRQLKKVI